MSTKRYLARNRLLPFLIVLGLFVYQYYLPDEQPVDHDITVAGNIVQQAYAAHRSGQWLETSGHVGRVLSDDNEGARHQRFILELDDGHTVMVAHNIDLAERIPVHKGLALAVRGRYEWNDRGGVIHWTHHDPDGRMQGGWVMLGNVRYQ
jgi:hypothetical protein